MRLRGLAGLYIMVWLLAGLADNSARAEKMSPAGNPIITLRLNKAVVRAEVVLTPEKLQLGLGGRKSLAWGSGMLFIMPAPGVQEFWMQGMLFPIDIIWLAQDRIIGLHQNLSPKDSRTFQSPGPADMVLEVPAGFVKASGLRTGDRVERL